MSGAQQNNHPAVKDIFIFVGGRLTLPQRSLMMKRLESVAFENSQLKHQLSKVAAENGSLRLDIQRNVKASTVIPFQIDRPLTFNTL